jgi:hypothetical protein
MGRIKFYYCIPLAMNLNYRVPLSLLLIWLTVSLGAILPTMEIEFGAPISTNPPPNVVSPPTEESQGNPYFMYFLQAIVFGIVVIAIVGGLIYRRHLVKEALSGVFSLIAALLIYGLLYILADRISFIFYSQGSWTPSNPGSTPFYSGNMLILLSISIFMGVIFALLIFKAYGRKEIKIEEKRLTIAETMERAIYKVKIGKDVRGAILSAYKEMEKLMRSRGVEDKDYYTPREFREFALNTLKISQAPLDTLTNLFEIARYSAHEMTEEHRKLALKALEEIRNAIRGK